MIPDLYVKATRRSTLGMSVADGTRQHNTYVVGPEELKRRFLLGVPKNRSADECWEWSMSRLKSGYGRVIIGGRQIRAHRVSYEVAHGRVPSGLNVLHHCDNPPCVNPVHLYAGTQLENCRDVYARNRMPTGFQAKAEEHPMRKLSWEDVREIRTRTRRGRGFFASLGREFGVTPDQISNVYNRKSWAE